MRQGKQPVLIWTTGHGGPVPRHMCNSRRAYDPEGRVTKCNLECGLDVNRRTKCVI
jgi:hypothetical protein